MEPDAQPAKAALYLIPKLKAIGQLWYFLFHNPIINYYQLQYQMENITTVQKEQLNSLKFFKNEAISETVHQRLRKFDLDRALILGNIDHNKVTIIFKTEDGSLLQVNTTIWAVTEDYVALKGGVHIPIKAIVDLKF